MKRRASNDVRTAPPPPWADRSSGDPLLLPGVAAQNSPMALLLPGHRGSGGTPPPPWVSPISSVATSSPVTKGRNVATPPPKVAFLRIDGPSSSLGRTSWKRRRPSSSLGSAVFPFQTPMIEHLKCPAVVDSHFIARTRVPMRRAGLCVKFVSADGLTFQANASA